LLRVLEADPANATAWLWLSSVLSTTEQALHCIEQVLRLNPTHARAREAREVLRLRLIVEEAAIFKEASRDTSPPSTRQRRLLLGELLVDVGPLTSQQLDQVLVEQAQLAHKARRPVRLGDLLVRRKLIGRAQLEAVLAIQIEQAALPGQERWGSTIPIGEFLVQRGLVTRPQLAYGLKQQAALRQQGKPLLLGEILVRLGYLQRMHLHRAVLAWHQAYNLLFD